MGVGVAFKWEELGWSLVGWSDRRGFRLVGGVFHVTTCSFYSFSISSLSLSLLV